jgi:thymidylate synthase
MLQEVLAGWIGVNIGPYVQLSDSLHVYTRDLQDVEAASRVPAARNDDSIALPRESAVRSLADLESRVNELIRPGLDLSTFEKLSFCDDLPIGYANLLAILGADVARRRGWTDMMARSVTRCTNAALVQMWERWHARKGVYGNLLAVRNVKEPRP